MKVLVKIQKNAKFLRNAAMLIVSIAILGYAYQYNQDRKPSIINVNKNIYKEVSPVIGLLRKMTVRVWTGTGTGSGVIISDDMVLTNYHVIQNSINGRTVWIDVFSDKGATRTSATIETKDAARDLAALKVSKGFKFEHVPEIIKMDPAWGEVIIMVGSPNGLPSLPTQGFYCYRVQGRHVISCNGFWGNSGGPIFTRDGKLVGMTAIMARPKMIEGRTQAYPTHLFYCITQDWINGHIRDNNITIKK